MNILARSLFAALCHLPGGLCLAQQATLDCPEIRYEAPNDPAAQSAPLTVDRLEGQAVSSVPEIPRMLGSLGNFCLGLFADAPVKAVASASTGGGGVFVFENVASGDYVLIGRHASGEGGTL